MFRVSPILSRTLSATRFGSAASFAVHNRFPKAVHNRFLQALHYSSSSSRHSIVRLLQWYEFYRKPPPVLYQLHSFPDGKLVRVFLDYHDIPYKVVDVDPSSKKEIKWSKYKDLPILIVDGEQLNGTSAIIDGLRQKFPLKEKTDSTSADFEEIEWRWWAENDLYLVLEFNMFQTFSDVFDSMDYLMGHHNFMVKSVLKYLGAAPMYFIFKRYRQRIKQEYGISGKRAARAALYEAAETWVDALYGWEFRGVSKPNLADMAVFGMLRPVRYMKCGKDMVVHTRIGEWYTRMENAVGKSSRIGFF